MVRYHEGGGLSVTAALSMTARNSGSEISSSDSWGTLGLNVTVLMIPTVPR